MNLESAKIMKIIDELGTHFLHTHKAALFNVSLTKEINRYKVRLEIGGLSITESDLESYRKKFSHGRKSELEDYYWQLTGEIENPGELALVAMMCDSFDLSWNEGVLIIDIERKF